MPWGTVDDRFYDHDKVLELPSAIRNAAVGLYWRAISYSNAKLTDGFVSSGVVEHLDGTPELVDGLVGVRLWHRRRGGFTVHDFLDGFNKSRADVEEGHRKKAEAGRLGGHRSGESRRLKHPTSGTEPDTKQVLRGRLNSESESESDSESNHSPVAPSPARGRQRRRTNGVDGSPYDAMTIRDSDPDPGPAERPDWAGPEAAT